MVLAQISWAIPPRVRNRQVVTVYPEYLVPKQVCLAGQCEPLIQCREQESGTCSDSCYLWSFKAGPCQLKALYDGTEFQGEVVVLDKSAYHCTRVGAELKCEGPR